jgi:homocysteine S-methyltransferase
MSASNLPRHLVLDGGLATELAERGFDVSGTLWSARALVEAPELLLDVHADYYAAGADVITTASYQASYGGFAAIGLTEVECTRLLRRSVTLAQAARDQIDRDHPRARPRLVAASLGPYGATLNDGSEYRGDYALTEDELVDFHRQRFGVLASAGADLMACETIPSLLEARALLRLLREHPSVRAWVSFTCRDGTHTAAGDELTACAALLDAEPQVSAMGVNCVPPHLTAAAIRCMAETTTKPIVAYPNSGEQWNAVTRAWEGSAESFASMVPTWLDAGARWIGGCCRTGPVHVQAIRAAMPAEQR